MYTFTSHIYDKFLENISVFTFPNLGLLDFILLSSLLDSVTLTLCTCRCSECQKTFQYPSQLQNHMMKHKDIRPYICSECGMEFIQSHHLKQHTLTHKVGLNRSDLF